MSSRVEPSEQKAAMDLPRRVMTIVAIVACLGVLLAGSVALGPRLLTKLLRPDVPSGSEPRIGDLAPDAVLTPLDGTATVHLKERIGGRPLILIFGSYT